ncbi:MAG TPA: SDR family NAD(P)-dependent oxidoreductase [Stellaceae bacterium]|jgi:NADP-dependent 3-hydroxy acid dehydrogenase YdfG
MENLPGKVAFITGGASGIGLGIAKAFAKAGMKVAIADIRQDHLDGAVAEFKSRGQSVHPIRLDVTDRPAMAAAAEETVHVFGKVHVLVNNAGIGIGGPLKQAKYDDWDWGLDVNLNGVVNGIQEFLPYILKHGEGGHIVNTSSMAAVLPISRAGIYIAAKAAVMAISEVLRGELADDKIGVSAFCPGPVQTNIAQTRKLRPERFRKNSGYAEFEQRLEDRPNNPLWMDHEEVGERVLHGVRRNDLFIFTHPEFKDGIRQRCEAILAAFPDEPLNKERAAAITFLTSNPIYRPAGAD